MNILFICTSNKDRSPALQEYFSFVHNQHQYKSAGINKYFCEKNNTHYLTQEDIDWADVLVFAEDIHYTIFVRDFAKDKISLPEGRYLCRIDGKHFDILRCGEYEEGAVNEDYLTKSEIVIKEIISAKTINDL